MYRLDERQAFQAMYLFREKQCEREKSDGLTDLVSFLDCSIWANGMPADPAQWYDWLKCVNKISPAGPDGGAADSRPAPEEGVPRHILDERQAFQAVILFLEQFDERGEAEDIAALLNSLRSSPTEGAEGSSAYWSEWLECVVQSLDKPE